MPKDTTALEAVTSEKVTAEKVEQLNVPHVYTHFDLPPIESVRNINPSLTVEGPIYDDSPADALKRYNGVDSTMFPNNPSLPLFGDFTNIPNIAESQLIVSKAKEQFDGLDASVRAKFNNSFDKFAEFVNSPDFNIEYLMTEEVKNGIYRRKQLDDLLAKNQKDYEDWLLAHPNWQAEQEASLKAQKYKEFDEYLKSKNLLQG